MRMTLKSLLILAALLIAWRGAKAMAEDLVLDEFEELQGWTAIGSPGVRVELAHDTGRRPLRARHRIALRKLRSIRATLAGIYFVVEYSSFVGAISQTMSGFLQTFCPATSLQPQYPHQDQASGYHSRPH